MIVHRAALVSALTCGLLGFVQDARSQSTPIPISAPGTLGQSGATYQLTQDVTCNDSCFTVTGDNITFDLNGHVITYGDGFVADIPNAGFELGTGTKPDQWDLSRAPGAQRVAKTYFWENYELQFQTGSTSPQVIRSQTVTLLPGKTYNAFVWAKSLSAGAAVALRVVNAGSTAVIASGNSSGDNISSGWAIEFGFKPSAQVSVYLEVEVSGTNATVTIDQADIKPTRSYGIASWHYRDAILFPDLSDSQFANGTNITVKNGTIRQGRGKGTRSTAFRAKRGPKAFDLVIEANSVNSHALDFANSSAGFEIRRVNIKHDSIGVFHRMVPAALINGSDHGTVIITDSTLEGGAQQGISLYCDGNTANSLLIEHNTIKNFSKVTNGYAIALSGVRNFTIRNNQILPILGRGILLDTTSGTGDPSNANGEIAGNTIEVKEKRNHEFGEGGLQAAGIRIRDYPPSFNQADIHNNTIRAFTGPGYVHQANGITGTIRADQSNITIENNDIKTWTTDPGMMSYALLFEDTLANSKVVVRNNTLASNAVVVRLGDEDGFSTSGIDFVSNTFAKGTEAGGPAFHTMVYGYWTGTQTGNDFLDGRYLTGTSPSDIAFEGEGAKDLTLSWYLTVVVQDERGQRLANATVTTIDKDGKTTTDMTDAAGQVVRALPQYQQSGATGGSFHDYSPYTVRVQYQTETKEQPVDLSASTTTTFTFTLGSGNTPPQDVQNLHRNDRR